MFLFFQIIIIIGLLLLYYVWYLKQKVFFIFQNGFDTKITFSVVTTLKTMLMITWCKPPRKLVTCAMRKLPEHQWTLPRNYNSVQNIIKWPWPHSPGGLFLYFYSSLLSLSQPAGSGTSKRTKMKTVKEVNKTIFTIDFRFGGQQRAQRNSRWRWWNHSRARGTTGTPF